MAYCQDLGIEAEGFDFSKWAVEHPYYRCRKEWLRLHDATEPWPYGDRQFDLVICLDTLEHIYEEDIDFVMDEMYRVSRRWVFLQIATVDGMREQGFILRKGEPIPLDRDPRTWAGHVTVCTEEWWYDRLDRDDWVPRRDLVNWFCGLVDPDIIHNWLLNSIIIMERL